MNESCKFESKVIQLIDFWVANFKQEDFSQSAPLLISGAIGCGKSSLISSWIRFHKVSSSKDNNLIIYENPGLVSNPTYTQSLFNILSKLKEEYNLNIKLTAKEERLRTLFTKLFDVSHSLPIPKRSRKCVIIIFDGIDKYTIGNGKEDSAEWLPVTIPDNIRVIYTCNQDSEAFSALKDYCRVISLPGLKNKHKLRVLDSYLNRYPEMQKSENLETVQMCLKDNINTENPLFLKLLIFWGLSKIGGVDKFLIPTYKETPCAKSLFTYAVRFFNDTCKNKIKKVFAVIKLAKRSLAKEEIALSSGVSLKITGQILEIFDCCLNKHEGLYCFSNTVFRDSVEIHSVETVAREITLALEEQNNPSRMIELLNALKLCKDWKRLKDKLRNLQIFVSMFNTQHKIELLTLWVELEKFGFDPVEEYNKVVEDFIIYHPLLKNDEIVTVVLNFFCFFQEYGLIECPKSVNFRNYPLTDKESLEKANLFLETNQIPGIFNSAPESPLFLSEKQIFEESSRDELREIVSKLNLDSSKKSFSELYHYKRWFWIQFPLIALSHSINPSTSLDLYRDKSGILYDKEQEIFESLSKILSLNQSSTKLPNSRPQTTKPLLNRGSSLQLIRNNVGFTKVKTTLPTPANDSQIFNKSHLSLTTSKTLDESKPEIYSISFSLKDTGINTVLLKLNSQLVKFSEVEVKKVFKQTQKLQQQFDKLRGVIALKEKQKESIAIQITQLQAKYLEKEEVLQRFMALQFQTNKNLEKLSLAQAEVEYTEKILECCVKNPPFVKEWNSDMIRAIEVCEGFIQSEKACIELYNKDTFEYLAKFQDLKAAVQEKRTAGTTTLTKLSEKYSLNAFINQKIVKGFNRRKVLLMTPDVQKPSPTLKDKIKTRKTTTVVVKIAKKDLEIKLRKYEENARRLVNSCKDKDVRDIKGVIVKLKYHFEMINQKDQLAKELSDLKIEKTLLEEKLKYLKSMKKPQVSEEVPKNVIDLSDRMESVKNRVIRIREKVENQELKIDGIKEIFQQIWKNFQIPETCNLQKNNIKEQFTKLGMRFFEVDSGNNTQSSLPKPKIARQKTKIWNAVADKKLFSTLQK